MYLYGKWTLGEWTLPAPGCQPCWELSSHRAGQAMPMSQPGKKWVPRFHHSSLGILGKFINWESQCMCWTRVTVTALSASFFLTSMDQQKGTFWAPLISRAEWPASRTAGRGTGSWHRSYKLKRFRKGKRAEQREGGRAEDSGVERSAGRCRQRESLWSWREGCGVPDHMCWFQSPGDSR
jgi:hypothetical protein